MNNRPGLNQIGCLIIGLLLALMIVGIAAWVWGSGRPLPIF